MLAVFCEISWRYANVSNGALHSRPHASAIASEVYRHMLKGTVDHTIKERLIVAIRNYISPDSLFPSAATSIIVWLMALLIGASFSALIFQGRLAGYFASGMGMFLVSAIVLHLLTALFSSDAAVIPSPQDTSAVILGAMVANLVALAPVDMSDDILFVTVVATMALSSILTGIAFLFFGSLRIANLIRYIPYPVIGGFLAGTGWLLFRGSFTVILNLEVGADTLMQVFGSKMLASWLPALVMTIALLVILRRSKNKLVLPFVIICALLLIGGGQQLYSAIGDSLFPQDGGLTLVAESIKLAPLNMESLKQVDIALVLTQAGGIAVLIIFSTVNLLLNVGGQELMFNRELDFNRELTVAGAGNLLGGLVGGGIVGFPTLAASALLNRIGGNGRIVNLAIGSLLTLTLAFGIPIFVLFPRVILGGVLMFLGISFLVDWLYDAWFKMPKQDYLIIVLILLVIAAFGLLWGIAVGILVSMILFVLEYSQIRVIRQEFSGKGYRSNIDRSHAENQLLRNLGHRILVYRLQGYIFFGTGYQFYQHIRSNILRNDPGELLYIILDFRLVNGMDISTVVDFTKLRLVADAHGIHVLLAGVSPQIRTLLLNSGFMPEDAHLPINFSDLDHALEWCEERLLELENLDNVLHVPVAKQLDSHSMVHQLDIAKLSKYLTRIEARAGDRVAFQGGVSDSLFVIESGKVDIVLTSEHGEEVRLRSMKAGTIVGEIGFYLDRPRSATIIVTETGVVQQLTRAALHQMEIEDPLAAVAFHSFVSYVLSGRLTTTNHMVEALMD